VKADKGNCNGNCNKCHKITATTTTRRGTCNIYKEAKEQQEGFNLINTITHDLLCLSIGRQAVRESVRRWQGKAHYESWWRRLRQRLESESESESESLCRAPWPVIRWQIGLRPGSRHHFPPALATYHTTPTRCVLLQDTTTIVIINSVSDINILDGAGSPKLSSDICDTCIDLSSFFSSFSSFSSLSAQLRSDPSCSFKSHLPVHWLSAFHVLQMPFLCPTVGCGFLCVRGTTTSLFLSLGVARDPLVPGSNGLDDMALQLLHPNQIESRLKVESEQLVRIHSFALILLGKYLHIVDNLFICRRQQQHLWSSVTAVAQS